MTESAGERLFEWPSQELTIEFQGGEPLLNFGQVKAITRRIVERNRSARRTLRFVLASTLHDLTDDQLAFLTEHRFKLSTSLDGPEWLHNANRPRPGRDSYRRTVDGIERGRRWLGDDGVSALTTLTRQSLEVPEAIIDEYRKLGFHSISLRPLSPYGFATKTARRTGYPTENFLAFYRRAFDHLLSVNLAGYAMEESYASLLLSQLFTSFGHGYVDLRSPFALRSRIGRRHLRPRWATVSVGRGTDAGRHGGRCLCLGPRVSARQPMAVLARHGPLDGCRRRRSPSAQRERERERVSRAILRIGKRHPPGLQIHPRADRKITLVAPPLQRELMRLSHLPRDQ
ncbi:TPA: hypothetical protein ACOENU_001262 [Stenotrophomonas maltophilia]